ncbi:MAG: sugar transferase [Anaerolineae bacterium]|nr:sugar transferase [Anaerolineae bacterium]NUQ06418.1 sugar transferase [Anaerolineae bacterium]
MYRRWGKRLFDVAAGLLALVVLSPVMLLVALYVRVRLGSPILFKQQRPGLCGKPFTIYKFRTMNNARDADGNLLPDTQRLGRVGRVLRASSLDELPEIINVLKGEMSLVGPRPLLMQYLALYASEQARRHEVRPGITGAAQINGRNEITWEQKFERDVWYVDHYTFLLDVKIMAYTVIKIVRREGISKQGHATTEAFIGSPMPVSLNGKAAMPPSFVERAEPVPAENR